MRRSATARALGEGCGLEADGTDQEVDPLLRRERLARSGKHVEHVRLRHLDGAQRLDGERPAALLLGRDAVVAEA
jgi:hypothetical protein